MIRHQDIGMDCAIVVRDENRKQIQEPKDDPQCRRNRRPGPAAR
jgi:hypothetical protein